MSDSERVYKMDEAARIKNREAQKRFRLRRKLKQGDAIAIGSDMGTPAVESSPVAVPGAQTVVHLGPHGYPED